MNFSHSLTRAYSAAAAAERTTTAEELVVVVVVWTILKISRTLSLCVASVAAHLAGLERQDKKDALES